MQPPRNHVFVLTNENKAAADARIGARRALRERSALMGLLRSCFARTQTWLQAGKYVNALVSDLPSRNGWSAAEHAGDRSPDRSQRLLNRASWDEEAAMSLVRKYAAAGLDAAARRSRRRRTTVGALDETAQEKQGSATAGVKRQYLGCAGRVANGINTVHLSYVREKTGHALAGARQWIPAGDIKDPVKSLVTGLPLDLRFRTKGQLAIDILTGAYSDGLSFGFVCGDEVYGSCTELRRFLEVSGQAYVLRVASSFILTLAGAAMACADAVKTLLKNDRRREVRSAGSGSKGDRWYAWAWISTASPGHSLLVRRHLKTGELAFHYRYVPEGQLASKASRSAQLPPPGSGTGPAPRPRRLPARMHHRLPNPASSRSPSPRSGGCSPTSSSVRSRPATPPAGSNGGAATRHDPAGSTNAHAWRATTPWSASDWMLPY
jgi:SRSO17 transposase